MAFSLKFGGLMKQSVQQPGAVPMTSMLNIIRCMSSKVFVGGLSWGTDHVALKEAFSSYGDVIDAKVVTDRDTGRSRGFGFVEFATEDSANSAISAMDGQELDGRNIRVNIANDRPPRNNYGGGGYPSGGGGGYPSGGGGRYQGGGGGGYPSGGGDRYQGGGGGGNYGQGGGDF